MAYKIALFASGNGTNAEAIIQYFAGHPEISVAWVLSNNPSAGVLARAAALDVPCQVFDKRQFQDSNEILNRLLEDGVTHLVLAGFLWLIPKGFLEAYRDKIINIHPAILPGFGGKGMYGRKVHEAVRAAGIRETGITIHLVNEHYDEGEILFQKKCGIDPNDSVDDISKKVRVLEHEYYPKVIEGWILKDRL